MSPLVASLWVTLIGMVVIFVSVLLLWGMMEVLVRFTARSSTDKHDGGSVEPEEEPIIRVINTLPAPVSDQKIRAIAAAVAVALSLRRPTSRAPLPQTSGSAWQAVNRTRQLTQPTHITRKS
jgi:Na+-transporting methylmalonyl-CoA/oxaloacetate decarboxylase gamma subunit